MNVKKELPIFNLTKLTGTVLPCLRIVNIIWLLQIQSEDLIISGEFNDIITCTLI
jgi:hypothetical protein